MTNENGSSKIKCLVCDATIKNNRWAKIRAHTDGWFFTRSGKAFCPKHRPTFKENL